MDKIGLFIKNGLAERLNQIDKLTIVIEQYMATPIQNRVWPLLRNRRLLLLTDDTHFATQARFMQKGLCKHVNDELNLKLIGLDIKLISLPLASYGQKSSRLPVNKETAVTLVSIAGQIEDDELRNALLRVVQATQKAPTSTAAKHPPAHNYPQK